MYVKFNATMGDLGVASCMVPLEHEKTSKKAKCNIGPLRGTYENRKFFLGPGRSNMGLGDHIGCPKVFPRIF